MTNTMAYVVVDAAGRLLADVKGATPQWCERTPDALHFRTPAEAWTYIERRPSLRRLGLRVEARLVL